MKMKITLHGVAYEVEVEVLDEGDGLYNKNSQTARFIPSVSSTPMFTDTPVVQRASNVPTPSKSNEILAPVGGTIVEVKLRAGDKVKTGQEILVLEAMKMQTAIAAPADAVIKSIPVVAGDSVREGQLLVEFN